MNFLQSLAQQFAGKPIDWDELEEALIRADLGVPMTMRIIKTLQEREAWALLGIGDVIKAVRTEIARILPHDPAPIRLRFATKRIRWPPRATLTFCSAIRLVANIPKRT